MFEKFATLALKNELRVYENRIKWRIYGPQRKKQKGRENYIMSSFIICALHQILLRRTHQGGFHSWFM
jgi:hypothetical protein